MAFPATPLDCIVQIALGADLTASPAAWSWTDITSYVWMGDGAEITITRGRGDEFATAAPSRISLTLRNQDGRFCPRNPEGPYYGTLNRNTPIRVRVHNGSTYVTQATGFVDQWPVTWGDKSQSTSFAPITASGALRRLGQGGTLRSALHRFHAQTAYLEASTILGYWPCEDEPGSTSIASGIGGQAGTMSGGVENFGADADIAGSGPLMTLEPGVSFILRLRPYTSTGQTAIRAITKIPTAPAGNVELLRWWTTGSYTVWTVEIVPGSPDRLHLRAYNSLGVEQLGGTGIDLETGGPGSSSLYGRQLYLVIDLTQSGADIDWSLIAWHTFAFDSGSGASTAGTETSATVGTLEAIGSHSHSANADGITLGHIAVADDTGYGAGSAASTGFGGESVAVRFGELAQELDLSATTLGTPGPGMTTYVGASTATDIVSLLREMETAEQGVLFDRKTAVVGLLLRVNRYNQAVALTLNHDASEVDWLSPTDDDQSVFNDVTVSRPGGSEARAFDRAHVAANGNYSQTVDALLFQDTDLPYHAQWRLHLGTVDELRYPTVGLCLTRVPSKLADWLACDIGSRIQITNPPTGLPPDTIDLHVEGYTEHIGRDGFDYRVELNCSPASAWQVFEAEDSSLGRVGQSTSTLLCDYDSSATSLLFASKGILNPDGSTYRTQADAAVPLWSTTDESYDIAIAGERLTVTSMAAPAPSFVGAGSATHGDNATLAPGIHASAAKGDVILVFAAIRNTAATVNGPAGYTVLMGDGHVGLFGKVHDGSESSPSITFTGGSAGDTTSAQTATFRGFQLQQLSLSNLSNSSAQDIAFPGVFPVKANCLALWLGWKQDDWTSVADLAGRTEIAEFTSTTGSDQGLIWNYVIQTNPAEVVAGSWTVTGGASAISKGYVLALPGDVQTATVTRSVNTVTKSQSAGAAVSLWKPGVAAL